MTVTDIDPQGGLELGGSATVAVTHGAAAEIDLVVEWDFDNDGDFDEDVEDITEYVLELESLTGRDWPSHLTGEASPGRLRMTLTNMDDRFSYFNTSSPLNTGDFSLKTGRRVRVRDRSATPDDPVLLARDRFNRADAGSLAAAETGQMWTAQLNSGFNVADNTAVAADGAAESNTVATLDCGATDHYVQASVPYVDEGRLIGVVARWEDSSNYIRAYVQPSSGIIQLAETVGGVADAVDTYTVTPWPGMTIGLGVVGDDVTVYLGGVAVITATTTLVDGTEVGLFARKNNTTQRPPALDDFYVWDHVAAEVEGVLWSGDIADVQVSVRGMLKRAVVEGEGPLARAARADVLAPRVPLAANLTGPLVGDVMARAGLLHPPAPGSLDEGTVTCGPVGLSDGDALELARQFEETERGFLHETNEGYIGFQDAAGRATATSQAWFSDTPGAGQFCYTSIAPLDQSREIVNRVTAGVAPSAPSGISLTTDSDTQSGGVANHVDITLPTTAAGDLLVIIARRASEDSGDDWVTPIWWTSHRNDNRKDSRTQVFSHHCDGTESGDTVRFYTDSGAEGLPWVAHIYLIEEWYLASQGVAVTEFRGGRTPPPMTHGWGRVAALYIAAYTGCHGAGAGSVVGTTYPDGYASGATTVFTTPGDVFLSSARKFDIVDAEAPSAFDGDEDFALVESVLIAVRGYNGEHEVLPTIKNPNQFGPSPGRFVTVEDIDSQDEHNVVRSHVNAPNLFESEADAQTYGEGVVAVYSDDRPIFTMSFWADASAAYQAQATRRRVGDKITVKADGDAGLGIDGDFFIESINHEWRRAAKTWLTTWELSPA